MALITFDPGNKDIKKISGNLFMIAIAGVLGLLAWYYVLPFLNTIVWGTLELALGIIVGVAVFYVISQKSFWRSLKYLGVFLAQALLGWIIEMNPFGILEYRLEKTQESLNDMLRYKEKLESKAAELKGKIAENDKEFKLAIEKKDMLNRKGMANLTENEQEILEMSIQTITSNKEYIDGVMPLYKDVLRLLDYTHRAYKTGNIELLKSRKDLAKKRDLFETVTTSSAMVSKAWQALLGDDALNNDADKAIEALRIDISEKIGKIKTGLKVTSNFMDGKDLDNAAKLQETLKEIEGVDLDKVTYSSTVVTDGDMKLGNLTGGPNKYSSFLKLPNKDSGK